MHGAGNDYIYINAINFCPANLPELSNEMKADLRKAGMVNKKGKIVN